MFLTTGLAKSYQRIVGADEDDVIALMLSAAESSAVAYLNRQVYADQASLDAAVLGETAGLYPIVLTDDMRVAILKIFGGMYENREDMALGVTAVSLPQGSRDLLRPHRISPGV